MEEASVPTTYSQININDAASKQSHAFKLKWHEQDYRPGMLGGT